MKEIKDANETVTETPRHIGDNKLNADFENKILQ